MPNPRGRPPKPTVLKIIEGNRGKRKLNDREPMPARGVPECPAWLDAEARAKWAALTPELDRLGLLTVVDGDALAGYCQAWAEFREATERLRKEGRYQSTPAGKRVHPACVRQQTALTMMAKFGAVFGLSPADRTRLAVDKSGERDDFEAFLQEKA